MKISNSQKRLLELMQELNISQTDICVKTNLPKSVLSMYVHGKREPRQDKISQIADAYNIDPAWLMGYDVPMKRETIEEKYSIENARLLNTVKNDEQIRDFVKEYIQLNDVNRNMVKTLAHSLLDNQ